MDPGLLSLSALVASAGRVVGPYFPLSGTQRVFSASINSFHTVPEGDPAGNPNIATRFEVTSPANASLPCAKPGYHHKAGYAHFTNVIGDEDKHMYWTLLEAKNDPENAPVILYFGGGPGTSGMTVPFSGQGHCQVVGGSDGNGTAVPSDFPWTDFAHILAIDHPVGTGYSYGVQSSLRNSSERASWDVDDLLQAFWRENPKLAKNQFAIGSGSYGGTYIPNLVNVIRERNIAAAGAGNSSRLIKMPDSALISNPYGDPVTRYRWAHAVQCGDFGYYNASVCDYIARGTPPCLDAFQLAEEQPTLHNKMVALETCEHVTPFSRSESGRNPYDVRQKCDGVEKCFPEFSWLSDAMGDPKMRKALGVPDHVKYVHLAEDQVAVPFINNGDLAQRAYKLLSPAVNDGMRLLVYNGMQDLVCPGRATEAWLRLLETKHQVAFRGAPEVEWPGFGSFIKVGKGDAGEFAFVKVTEAGHFVVSQQQEKVGNMIKKWLRNEPFL